MTNTELTRLMDASMIHSEDRPEIERIFACLTQERRVAILSDWPKMAAAIKRNRETVEEQKRLLLTGAVSGLADDLRSFNRGFVSSVTDSKLESFKKQI